MYIALLDDPNMAQGMADVNHAAFGYRTIPNYSRYEISKRMKSPQYEAYGAVSKGQLVGFTYVDHAPIEFLESPREKLIEGFGVLPWRCKEGIGTKILNHVVNILYPNSSFNLYVNVNSNAVLLYKKFGFISYGETYLVRSKNYIAMGLIRKEK